MKNTTSMAAGLLFVTIAIVVASLLLADPFQWRSTPRNHPATQKSAMRLISIGLEAYKLEQGVYPNAIYQLTSPLPYISSENIPKFESSDYQVNLVKTSNDNWILISKGVDLEATSWSRIDAKSLVDGVYDPTNGTTSPGDIITHSKDITLLEAITHLREIESH